MCESEAGGHRFTIDHYEPRSVRPDLETAYGNLFYACSTCNERKGPVSPPAQARQSGYRFFRSDEDIRSDHFEQKGILLHPKNGSNVADYTIERIDLNRRELRILRELRKRLWEAEDAIQHGIMALRSFGIDRLPPTVRANAVRTMRQLTTMMEGYENDMAAMLKDYAMSAVLEDGEADPAEIARRKERVRRLKEIEGQFTDSFRPGQKTST